MSKKIIILIIVLILTPCCTVKESSRGNIDTLTIISSDEDRAVSEHIIEYYFNQRSIMTPQEEYVYSIDWIPLENLNKSKLGRNILLLSIEHPIDNTIDILTNKICSNNNISEDLSSLKNLFAKNQQLIIIKALDTIDLENKLRNHFHWIAEEYNENIYSNYYDYIVSKGQNIELESIIADKFNLSMFVQEDYDLIKQDDDFIWIGRGYPYRWIMLYNMKKVGFNETDNLYDLFNAILDSNEVGIEIQSGYRKKTTLQYNDLDIDIYRGLYDHKQSQTGGPFALYLLDNINSDEVILVASVINNPGNTKMPHLLQMDALVRNINFLEERK